jgi:hypothetical protein
MLSTTSAANPGARSMVRHLEAGGWTEREASNLVALLHGLKPARSGWTAREIDHLRFLHSMVKTGRIAR